MRAAPGVLPALLLAACLPAPAPKAAPELVPVAISAPTSAPENFGRPAPASFACDGGSAFSANYGTEGETPSVVLSLDNGERVMLLSEPTDQGSRYGWPSDGTNYVLLTQGQTATVLLKDGSRGGLETPVYTGCKRQ